MITARSDAYRSPRNDRRQGGGARGRSRRPTSTSDLSCTIRPIAALVLVGCCGETKCASLRPYFIINARGNWVSLLLFFCLFEFFFLKIIRPPTTRTLRSITTLPTRYRTSGRVANMVEPPGTGAATGLMLTQPNPTQPNSPCDMQAGRAVLDFRQRLVW